MKTASVFALVLTASAVSAAEPQLRPPIACPAGVICAAQNLFDHDPGPGVRDFRCGALGYDGHDGVDIRVSSMAAERTGVNVLAAAEGTVAGARDGMADVGIAGAGRDALKNVECGNGVLIQHADGWATQYCHMKKGSIAVKKGDAIARGQTLGQVGLSGMTEFPHVHFALRKDGKAVDPFAPDGAPASCGASAPRNAFAPDALASFRTDTPLVLNAGFAAGPVTNEAIESGAAADAVPGRDPAALVAYGRAIGLATGDALTVTLIGPDGAELANNVGKPVPNPKAQLMAFAGRKRPPAGWPAGAYRGRTDILRDGVVLKREEVTLALGS